LTQGRGGTASAMAFRLAPPAGPRRSGAHHGRRMPATGAAVRDELIQPLRRPVGARGPARRPRPLTGGRPQPGHRTGGQHRRDRLPDPPRPAGLAGRGRASVGAAAEQPDERAGERQRRRDPEGDHGRRDRSQRAAIGETVDNPARREGKDEAGQRADVGCQPADGHSNVTREKTVT